MKLKSPGLQPLLEKTPYLLAQQKKPNDVTATNAVDKAAPMIENTCLGTDLSLKCQGTAACAKQKQATTVGK